MKGLYHIYVLISFIIGSVLIDLDHKNFSIKGFVSAFFGHPTNLVRGFLHEPIVFYCLLALTFGVFIHFKMDGVL